MRVVLPSNSSIQHFPHNSLAKFSVQLPHALDLSKGQWEFGLSEIQFHKSWFNVKDANMTIKKGEETTLISLKDGFYKNPDLLLQYLNKSIAQFCNEETAKLFSFNFNDITRTCQMTTAINKSLSFEFSTNLKHILGFNNMDINEDW